MSEEKVIFNLRSDSATRDLIDRAAKVKGLSRTDFILNAAREQAIETVIEQRHIVLSPDAFDKLTEILDSPPRPNPALVNLMNRRSRWAKPQTEDQGKADS